MNDISFRKVSSRSGLTKTIDCLRVDVHRHGGTASEIVNHRGKLIELTACKVPWGSIVIHKEVSKLEAIFWTFQPIE